MLNSEALYQASKRLQTLSKGRKLSEAIKESLGKPTLLDGAQFFLSLIDDARSEVEGCDFARAEKRARYLQELTNFRAQVFERFLMRDPNSVGELFGEGSVERIGAIADSVGERIIADPEPLDRSEFSERTKELIEEVREWDMSEYASRSLLLGLGLVDQMVSSTAISVSDTEVRRRITVLVAAFAVEYAAMDDEFATRWEKLKRWAKLGYQGASRPLGLTSDVASIAGLLPKP